MSNTFNDTVWQFFRDCYDLFSAQYGEHVILSLTLKDDVLFFILTSTEIEDGRIAIQIENDDLDKTPKEMVVTLLAVADLLNNESDDGTITIEVPLDET